MAGSSSWARSRRQAVAVPRRAARDLGPCAAPRGSAGPVESGRRRDPVEDLVDDGAGAAGGAPVVVDEPAGIVVGTVTAGTGDAGQLQPRPGQLVARPAA